MYNFRNQRRYAQITQWDVSNLRDELHVGDYVYQKQEREVEQEDGKIRIRVRFKKVMVLAKYKHLVVVTGNGTKVHTMRYEEILLHEWDRMNKNQAG